MRRGYLFVPLVALVAGAAPRQAVHCDADNGGLVLPAGYCATVFASLRNVRNIAVAPDGDIFAAGAGRGVTALRDRDGDGHADTTLSFGGGYGSGTGVALASDAILFSPDDKVVRFGWHDGSLGPADSGTVLVRDLPVGGNHNMKTVAVSKDEASIFVDHGSATNSCQQHDRMARSPGLNPCAERDIRAGVWRYDAHRPGQTAADGQHWGFGMRNAEALAIEPGSGVLWAAIHGRDQLGDNWGFSNDDNAEKPAEEFGPVPRGADYGWPYCYYDPIAHRKVQAPEYGGDGMRQDTCAARTQPAIGFPGHWAPMMLTFVRGSRFGTEYSGGAFLAFHGSWNRAPLPQAGYRVVFIPFQNGRAAGTYQTFATGAGTDLRMSAVAMAPDGSALFIGSDAAGKIWRVIPKPR